MRTANLQPGDVVEASDRSGWQSDRWVVDAVDPPDFERGTVLVHHRDRPAVTRSLRARQVERRVARAGGEKAAA